MVKKRRGARADLTGRSELAGHVRLYHWMMDCPAYGALRPVALALLLALARKFNGRNNGAIGLGQREAVDMLGMSDRKAIARAFSELEGLGFIVNVRPGGFNVKAPNERRATEWRLTWLPVADAVPTKEFMSWRPDAPAARADLGRGQRRTSASPIDGGGNLSTME